MKYLLVLSLSTFLFLSCKPSIKQIENESLPEDFVEFFNLFHTDSLYQLEHISFPLEGVQKANDGPGDILVPINWEKNSWIMHKAFNSHNGSFERTFKIVGPIIIEEINDKNQFFSMERRFAKIRSEWHLIYYGLKK